MQQKKWKEKGKGENKKQPQRYNKKNQDIK